MNRGIWAWTLLVILLACNAASEAVPAEDAEGRFKFELLVPAERQSEREGQLWVLGATDVRVTSQTVPVTDELLRERNARDVADAIATRYELGDVDGSMTRSDCRLGGVTAQCLVGRLEHEGTSYQKRIGVVRIGQEILVFDVMAPVARDDIGREQFELFRQTFQANDS